MNPVEIRKTFWLDAAKTGGIVAIVLFVIEILKTTLVTPTLSIGWLFTIVELIVLCAMLYVFSKRRGEKYGNMGYTFGQSMGYIIAMMLFAGFLLGIFTYIFQNYIMPGHYAEVMEEVFEQLEGVIDEDEIDLSIAMVSTLMKNPLIIIMGNIISYVLFGGFLGLFVSALVKRDPDIFADLDTDRH